SPRSGGRRHQVGLGDLARHGDDDGQDRSADADPVQRQRKISLRPGNKVNKPCCPLFTPTPPEQAAEGTLTETPLIVVPVSGAPRQSGCTWHFRRRKNSSLPLSILPMLHCNPHVGQEAASLFPHSL